MDRTYNELYKRNAQITKANHIANWCCTRFAQEDYVTAVLAAITLVEDKVKWPVIASGAKKPGSSEDVRILVLEELRRRIGPATVPEWSLAQQKAKESNLFKGLPTE